MQEIEFAGRWGEEFGRFGFECFEDFFDYSDGRVINRNEKRDVIAFSLGKDGDKKDFFMKRFYCPHFKDMLFTFNNFGYICSQARCEWNNANILLENGVGTYKPVCWGWERRFGIERQSFFITEKIRGQCFSDFVVERWGHLERSQREGIMGSLGQLVRRVHDMGISLPDLYVWHIFIEDDGCGGYDLAVIDLHRMKVNVKNRNEQIRNLGAFDFSMLGEYFDGEIREVFLDAYLGRDLQVDKEAIRRRLKNRSAVLSKRRRKPKY